MKKLNAKIKEKHLFIAVIAGGAILGIVLMAFIANFMMISGMKKEMEKNLNEKNDKIEEIEGVLDVMDDMIIENSSKMSKDFSSETTSAPYVSQVEIEKIPIRDTGTEELIKKDYIRWQNPEILGDLGMTTKEVYEGKESLSGGVRYVKVGKVVDGGYEGADLIVISSFVLEGMSGWELIRVLKMGPLVIFLSNHMSQEGDYLNEYISKYFSQGSLEKVISKNIVIEELRFPEKLQGANSRQLFSKDQHAPMNFFDNSQLKKAFVHSKYGQVWMTNQLKARSNDEEIGIELNSFDYNDGTGEKYINGAFNRGGFYLRAPDGTTVVYKFIPDIFEDSENDSLDRVRNIEISKEDGSKEIIGYEVEASGCGSSKYVYDETYKTSVTRDLVRIGKTNKSDYLYGFKDGSTEDFKALYDSYWVKEGEEKKSEVDFLEIYPKIFWKDPFGRLLAFYRADILAPAECGKPVIYLYPEEPGEFDVKVNPNKGMSISIPEYGNGWKVYSDEKSNIKNLADGKIYPYLFWEGSSDIFYQMPKRGFVIENNKLSEFFDDKLQKVGLIEKEIEDFKEFWIPKMEELDKPYYFVTFLLNDYMDKVAPLEVNPSPDTVIRIMMDYKGLDEYQKVSKMMIKTPERKGFTVVEWGGMLK